MLIQQSFFITVEPPLLNGHLSTMAISLQQLFFWWTVHTFTLVSTSQQWPLSSVPKLAIVEGFNCTSNFHIINLNNVKLKKLM